MIRFLEVLSFFLEWGYVFVFLKMIHAFLPLRKSRILRLAAFFAGVFLFTAIIYSNDFVNLFGAFLGMSLYIAAFHRGRWSEKITAVLVFYPAFIAVNYLMQDIGARCFFFVTGADGESSLGWTEEQLLLSTLFYTLSLLLRLLFWTVSWRILQKYLRQVTSNLTMKMWFMVDVFMLAPFVAIFTIIYFMPEDPLIVYPICGASLFSGFGCVYLVSYISSSIRTAHYVRELETKQKYYCERMRVEERVRSIYHDMKNHLLVLEKQIRSPETAEMIETLQREVIRYEDYVHTGNDILDIILKEKAELVREKRIDFSVTADLKGVDFIEPLDISTIFGNALDNAIEASEEMPEGERVILLKAGRVQNFFSILVENNCVKENRVIRGGTTKRDDFLHGFGIFNMRQVTGKYGGQLIARCEDGKFTLKILLPVPQ